MKLPSKAIKWHRLSAANRVLLQQRMVKPANHADVVGTASFANAELAHEAVSIAVAAPTAWAAKPASERAACLRQFADLMETHTPTLMMLAVRKQVKP